MDRRGLRKGEGRTWGAALSPWRHGDEEREATTWVAYSWDGSDDGRRGVTRWDDKHDASRPTSRLAMRVGNPSHSYHPQGIVGGAQGGRMGGVIGQAGGGGLWEG